MAKEKKEFTLYVKRGSKKYEVVPCGCRCSFAKVDNKYNRGIVIPEWYQTHCSKDCYLPKWWLNNQKLNVLGGLCLVDEK